MGLDCGKRRFSAAANLKKKKNGRASLPSDTLTRGVTFVSILNLHYFSLFPLKFCTKAPKLQPVASHESHFSLEQHMLCAFLKMPSYNCLLGGYKVYIKRN